MIDISILRAMVAAGAPVEAILAAIEADQLAEGERVQARRARDAERQRRWRHADKFDVTACHTESHTVTRSHSDVDLSLTSLLSSSTSTTKPTESNEVSKKERAVRARKSLLPDDWIPKPAHFAKGEKFNLQTFHVEQKADDMRNWAKSKAIMRADWDATFHGFLKPREGQNGFGGSRTLQDDSRSVGRAAERLAEKFDQGKLTFSPRPSLVSITSEADRRLLPKG